MTGDGLDALVSAVADRVYELRSQISGSDVTRDFSTDWERNRLRRDSAITIEREERHAWRVSGGAVERMVIQTDWDNDEAIAFLQHRLDRIGLDDRLAKAGCVQGDEVRILGFDFAFVGEGASDEYSADNDNGDEVMDEFHGSDE